MYILSSSLNPTEKLPGCTVQEIVLTFHLQIVKNKSKYSMATLEYLL